MEEKSKIKARFMYANDVKHLFPTSNCVVPISVGQHYHEGAKFKATIDLINRHFQECELIIADSLQRHTLALFHETLSENELFQLSLQNGDDWLGRNNKALQYFTIPYRISRWESWKQRPEFPEKSQLIEHLLRESDDFEKALYETANIFIERLKKRTTDLDIEKAINQSVKYIKEECAFALILVKESFSFFLYPGKHPLVYEFFNKKLMQLQCPNLLQNIVINFR